MTGNLEETMAHALSAPLSVGEVAQQAGVSEQAVRKALAEGRLAGERTDTCWLIPAEQAAAWTERARRRKALAESAVARRYDGSQGVQGVQGDEWSQVGPQEMQRELASLRERLRVVVAERDALAAALDAITGSMRAAG